MVHKMSMKPKKKLLVMRQLLTESVNRLLKTPIYLGDIFIDHKIRGKTLHTMCEDRGYPCEPNEFSLNGRPMQSCRPGISLDEPMTINPTLNPIRESKRVQIDGHYSPSTSRNESKTLYPLRRGTFYLTHGWEWTVWTSKEDNRYKGGLEIVYILTIQETELYRRAHPLITPRTSPSEEIIAVKWPVYWKNPKGYTSSFQPKSTLQIPLWNKSQYSTAINEQEFTKKFMQMIPLGSGQKIKSLNYPK